MKKPFLLLKGKKNLFALILCVLLSAACLFILFSSEDSVAVFAQGDESPKSLYSLVASLI